mmetsp:Transcript_58355/g.168991  ORF Transcript_58355/g.168991 Transcript_58355/m.168991 type:complete len:396 (+) Transcript_58355:85-1272(+)
MPWIGGARRCFLCLNSFRRCFIQDDPDQIALRNRILDIDRDHDVVYRIFPPRRIARFLRLERSIGAGGYGMVFLATATPEGLRHMPSLQDGRKYAIKRIPMKRRGLTEEIGRSFLTVSVPRHLEVLDMMQNPGCFADYFVKFYAFIVEVPRNIYQVMEFLEGPDLFDYIAGREHTMPEAMAARLAKHVFTALHHLHRTLGAIHRDVKPENFGFASPLPPEDSGQPMPTLKLFDMGLAWVLPEAVTEETSHKLIDLSRAGTPLYMAPETWDGRFGAPTDIWSGGLIAYLLLSLELPFDLLASSNPAVAVRRNPLQFAPDCWNSVSVSARDLISRILDKDPAQRASTTAILADPWLNAPGRGPAVFRTNTAPLPATRLRRDGESSELWHTAASIAWH